MSRIGQTYKRKLVLGPIPSEGARAFRPDHHYGRLASLKLGKVLAQLRQMRAAVWSREPTVEDEQDVLPSAQFGESEHPAVKVGKFEIGGQAVDLDVRQSLLSVAT
jgi:hypothetical protein